MNDSFIRKSNIIGKEYDYFKTVKILNMKQVAGYLLYGLELLDVRPSLDQKTKQPILVFYFDKEKSQEAYKLWLDHALPLDINDDGGAR